MREAARNHSTSGEIAEIPQKQQIKDIDSMTSWEVTKNTTLVFSEKTHVKYNKRRFIPPITKEICKKRFEVQSTQYDS
jgi:hypothetical protein